MCFSVISTAPMLPLASVPLPVWMFLAGCALLTWILLKRSGRYFGRARRERSSSPIDRQPRPSGPWSGAQRDTLARIEREQVELQERARELSGQLNSKILVLEQLIATSGRQIQRLESLLSQTASQESEDTQKSRDDRKNVRHEV